MLRRILTNCRSGGLQRIGFQARQLIFPKRADCLELCRRLSANKRALEIGGPSRVFDRRGILPVYAGLKRLDQCNFAPETTWTHSRLARKILFPDLQGLQGRTFIAEGTDLGSLPAAGYDCLLASHVLEHIANPLLALSEWKRVLSLQGLLILLLPHKEASFDHRRPLTSLEHLQADEQKGTDEDDLTHLPEILKLHDLSRDPGLSDPASFEQRCRDNAVNRCLHHHVFDTDLAVRLLDLQQFSLLAVETLRPHHILLLAQNPPDGQAPDNRPFLADSAEWKQRSPFPSDRRHRKPASTLTANTSPNLRIRALRHPACNAHP